MNPPLFLSLVFHLHQPVGNLGWVFEQAYQQAYLPLLEALERHPAIQVGLHVSGSLWDWISGNRIEYAPRLRKMVARGQVEILTSGYYEPILPVLTDDDKVGQITKLSRTIEKELGIFPRGLWLTERVWEPYLPKPLARAGVHYTLVDDAHFFAAGFEESDLCGYYLSEEQGERLAVFPSLSRLRYLIPYAPVEKVLGWLEERAAEPLPPTFPARLVCMGDDGEKFGLWPQSHELCWVEKYVDRLFEALENARDWLRTTSPGQYLEQFPPLGSAYLPAASYPEMMDWALPAHLSRELQGYRRQDLPPGLQKFLRGGFWRHFLVKYPEANHLHRRVARTSRRVANMPPGNSQDAAREHIWAAQCSCGYWHGIFGGVYLHHIRSANYANLLAADDILAAGDPQPAAAIEDVDMDGQSELTACCSPFYLHFDLARGGTLREWSHVPGRCNMVNVMTRREEAYHENLREAAAHGRVITPQMALWRGVETIHGHAVKVKEPGLETLLFQDWYRRGSFIDHFLRDDATCPGFYANRYPEEGDFVNLSYEGSWECRGAGLKVTLSRQGHVWVDGDFLPVRVAKTFTLRRGESTVDVLYQIQNLSAKPVVGRFGVETCTGLRGRVELASEWHPVLEVAEHNDVSHYLFQSSASDALRRVPGENIAGPETAAACALPTSVEVQMRLSHPSALWRFPLEPVVQSEGGFERAYQGVVFLHLWPIHLEPYAFWEVSFDIRVSLQRP